MAKALTDKTYKEVFKKATGKNSPNISFASIKDSNLNWASIANNKDANNKSTSSGSDVLRYPLNKDKREFDYLQVCAYQYEPRNFGTLKDGSYTGKNESGGNVLTGDYDKRDIANTKRKEKGAHTVFLPMEPSGLTDQYSTAWGDERINPLQILGLGVANKLMDLDAAGAMENLINAVGDGAGDLTPEVIKSYFAGKAIGANVLGRATGQTINNNVEVLFNGPGLRTFNYNYRFTPREPKEAKEIKNIIRFFKKQMAPKRSTSRIFLKSPNVFKLKYQFKNGDHPFLNNIKMCALNGFTVDYTPDGSYSTYNDDGGEGDGSMTSYNVGLSFMEMTPIYNEDFFRDSEGRE